ncbi:MAG TPA: adenylate/guanylate cyclase domain-containing protein [Thermoleophilaceae bacterium]|nr:adenylate/guanylate cyclase domain-containing protein [Thermoleophilaceae bacterium]
MEEQEKPEKRPGRASEAARRINRSPTLLTAARLVREVLPGDSRFGDPLSTAGRAQPEMVGKRLAELTAERPGLLREAGLTALQVWQAVSEVQGGDQGDTQLAIVFTDLVRFSDWALEAGDEAAFELLRAVGEAIEPPIHTHGGEVVKRLGDGMMAVFPEPRRALDAVREARERLHDVTADGYRPRIRAGMHVGRPRKIGGDYLGVDVNIAARMAEEAGADELLVSDRALALLDDEGLEARRKRRFSVKGVPKDLTVYSVSR